MSARVLVIDDEEAMLRSCRRILEHQGMEVDATASALEGRQRALSGDHDVLLLDLRMPELDGMEVLAAVRDRRPELEVILITGYATVQATVQAVKLGAFDVLPKPFTPDELTEKVRAALGRVEARRASQQPVPVESGGMVGASAEIARVRALVARVAPTDAAVLIVGETGTGKELVAREIHARSARRDKPFVSIDCSALAPGLLESELFGHLKGSFTGAAASKPGLFEIAHRGTLFLDEVAGLGAETQATLLRAVETGEIKRVGDVEARRVDIRLVAATNRDLQDLVREGRFRQDLYYRLNVVPIELPPLRERSSDIPLLVRHFVSRLRREDGAGPSRVAPEAMKRLLAWSWPGNVRELRNLVQRLMVTVEGDTIEPRHLPEHVVAGLPAAPQRIPTTNEELKAMKKSMRDQVTDHLERAFVIEALRRSDWNVSRAARQTGLLRPNFHALMRKHGIRSDEHDEDPGV